MRDQEKWDRRFVELAKHISGWSKDNSTRVGAVIADPKGRIVSVGYNGFPVGVEDTKERLENREVKYRLVVHAERNALLFARQPLDGCTIYTDPFGSCTVCAGMIVQSGIVRCVCPHTDNERWADNLNEAADMMREAGLDVTILRNTPSDS